MRAKFSAFPKTISRDVGSALRQSLPSLTDEYRRRSSWSWSLVRHVRSLFVKAASSRSASSWGCARRISTGAQI